MPEEKVEKSPAEGDTSDAAEAHSAGDQAPETDPISVTLADAKDSPEEGKVPSFRLREERERRTALEREAENLRQQNKLLSQAIDHGQQRPQPQPAEGVDEQALIAELENAEGASQAFSAMVKAARYAVSPELKALREENARLQRTLSQTSQQVGAVAASSYVAKELGEMRSKGLIDERVGQEISQRMAQRIQQDPTWGSPQNQPHLLNDVYMTMLRNGEITMSRKPNPANPNKNGTMPMQPGSGGGVETLTREQRLAQHDELLRGIKDRYPRRFGHMTLEQMRAIRPLPEGPDPVVPQRDGIPIEHAFVHRRD